MTLPTAAPDHVRISSAGRLGRIHLNRPDKINALTPAMVRDIAAALEQWRDDPTVGAVLIDGAGERGLCAGGDIAAVADGIAGRAPYPDEFWVAEYAMNLAIATYPKPVVSVMDGITFGGGIGVAGHASLRIVTETSQLAMPETAIGLSPDVGGLYLLSRLPGELGTHCALTGARLGTADALAAGLAEFFVPRSQLAALPIALEAALASIAKNAVHSAALVAAVTTALQALSQPLPGQAVLVGASWIDECYAGDDVVAIAQRLAAHDDRAAQQAALTLNAMSPTAVHVTLRALRNAAQMTLAQVLQQDLTVSRACAQHPDLAEGIRARIIDKDRNPRWQPASLADVDTADIDAFFTA